MLDPSQLPIVSKNKKGEYICLEGNRRLTALKAMTNPDLAKGTDSYDGFSVLHKRFSALGISAVFCVVMTRDEAFPWIQMRHDKGLLGIGALNWDAVARARSLQQQGKIDRWIRVIEFLGENGVDTDPILDRIEGKVTTVDSLFQSSAMKTVLGITFGKNGALEVAEVDKKAAVKLFSNLLDEMGKETFTIARLRTVNQQQEFLEPFRSLGFARNASAPDAASDLDADSDVLGDENEAGTTPKRAPPQPLSSAGARSLPSRPRKVLAEKGLRIRDKNLNAFYSELRKLNVEKHPHSAAVMIRVFLEKATYVFLTTMKVPCNGKGHSSWDDAQLKWMVEAALGKLDPQDKMKDLKPARDIKNAGKSLPHTLDTLNQYVHTALPVPGPVEILKTWDALHPYFSRMFEMIESQEK